MRVVRRRTQETDGERARNAELIARAEALSLRQLKVTVPIYQGDSHDKPEIVGSAVLLALSGLRFLVTAGHVFDRISGAPLSAGVSPELLRVAGLPTRLRSIGTTKPQEDKIDIGIMRVEGNPWEALEPGKFLGWHELDLRVPVLAGHTYSLVGFPNSVNRDAVKGDRIRAGAYRMAGLECGPAAYNATRTDPQTNLMIGFDKNAMWAVDGKRNAPDLYGSSGCGLWRYGRKLRDAATPPKLSAIAIEWYKKGRHKHLQLPVTRRVGDSTVINMVELHISAPAL